MKISNVWERVTPLLYVVDAVVACRHDGNSSQEPRRALKARAEAGIEVMRPADSQQGSEAAGPPVLPA